MGAQVFVTLLTSIFFVVVGSIAFNIGSIITGYSIFKQINPQQATFISGAVGSITFMLSPLGYVLFYPEFFVKIQDTDHYPIEIWSKVWDPWHLYPFAFSLIGLGLIFGAMKLLNLRWLLLNKIKTRSGIDFPIPADLYLWDHYFDTIEENAPLTITTHTNIIIGQLKYRSRRDEREELEVYNYTVHDLKGRPMMPGQQTAMPSIEKQIAPYGCAFTRHLRWNATEESRQNNLLLRGQDIRGIAVPKTSMMKDRAHFDYLVRSIYYITIAIGLLLLALAFHGSERFVIEKRDLPTTTSNNLSYRNIAWNFKKRQVAPEMAPFYQGSFTITSFLALIALGYATIESRRDYHALDRKQRDKLAWWKMLSTAFLATSTLHPWFVIFITVIFGNISFFMIFFVETQSWNPYSYYLWEVVMIFSTTMLLVLAPLSCFGLYAYRKLRKIFNGIAAIGENLSASESKLLEAIELVRLEIDLENQTKTYDKAREICLEIYGREIVFVLFLLEECVLRPQKKLIPFNALEGQHYNVLVAFKTHLTRDRP